MYNTIDHYDSHIRGFSLESRRLRPKKSGQTHGKMVGKFTDPGKTWFK